MLSLLLFLERGVKWRNGFGVCFFQHRDTETTEGPLCLLCGLCVEKSNKYTY